MERALTRLWYGERSAVSLALLPLSWLYGAIVALRHIAYSKGWLRTHRIDKPVVVVGNLTVGGTGKTPLVVWLVKQLAGRGFKPGIVSRGYGRTQSAPRWVEEGADWREVGDEPLLLKQLTKCPVIVAADRVAGARMLAAHSVDVIVADDGLQHLRLARDCEIVVVDGMRGFGNGYLLPAGPLREPLSRLESVDAIVVNGAAEHPALISSSRRKPGSSQMSLIPGKTQPLSPELDPGFRRGDGVQRVHAVAGIGNPARFFDLLRAQGFEVIEHPFPDHHPFVPADLRFDDDLPVLMTEKDAVKCLAFADSRMGYVPVTVELVEAQSRELLDRVVAKLKG